MAQTAGSYNTASSGYVAGQNPTRVYGVIVKADSSGSTVTLKDANTTEFDSLVAAASANTPFYYPGGLLFPNGCYLTVDAHTTYATVIYAREE